VNVVDSSGWIEYLVEGPNARFFAPIIEQEDQLLIPTIVVFEVIHYLFRQKDVDLIRAAIGMLRRGTIVPLDFLPAVHAARIASQHKLAMADSIIAATSLRKSATLWTQDIDFYHIPNVRYIAKKRLQ
jgi:predicted nucleic acid-binding protein